ncbi:TPA: helix-turn-helix transcriptional regulator [Serratia marcescens]|uniref:helix-turn-helix transcriptional regulator n=1 Tax=Serratia marcescens TaxID=615 RepID=UPI0029C3DA71|nr:helix-turn-helix transcriptional regulator [Serratia marcescens]
MVIHIISDDNFFALGCEEAIKTCNTYKTKKIHPNSVSLECMKQEITYDDVALIATNSFFETKKLLIILSCIGIRVLVFEDFMIKKINDSVNKKACLKALLFKIERICSLNKPTYEKLTKREVAVMNKILQGKSMKSISTSLKISLNTAYTHKINAHVKIGIRRYKKTMKNRDYLLP